MYNYRLRKVWKDRDYFFLSSSDVPAYDIPMRNRLERIARTELAKYEAAGESVSEVFVKYYSPERTVIKCKSRKANQSNKK